MKHELIDAFREAGILPKNYNYALERSIKNTMNFFKFYPIGQGLFYTGQLANGGYNFVYDCGSEERMTYIEDSIESFKNSIKSQRNDANKIDCVFISHLHKDHFSGLPSLIQKFKIEKLYLPYIGLDKNFIQLVLAYEIFCEKEDREFEIFDNSRWLFKILSSLYIERRWDTISEIVFTESRNSKSENGNTYSYDSFSINIDKTEYWKFAWFNKRIDDEKLKELEDNVNSKMIKMNITGIEDLINKNAFDQIKEIYIDIFGNNLNVTSTVLLHFPCFNPTILRLNFREKNGNRTYLPDLYRKHYQNNTAYTMLTGDAEFDDYMKNQINKYFDFNSSSISILQVPHHGSKTNWKDLKKINVKTDVYVISYGLGNTYHHPGKTVVNDIIDSEKKLISVNQTSYAEYYIH